ncbi:M48 family metallopeptidase [Cognaticolwellia mytili]|uniref:M48 family metallopeptidase n=1 Tax=Cognaticolwellia mytili TaxID=1888913 RepID=UPI000A1766B5|nr:SprT family zinc-dependent metalloprotease [Cognaticolwellia mytili]
MDYQLIRSNRRKTIALQVKNAQVIVRAPDFVKVEYIENLIQLKSIWLAKKIALQQLSNNTLSSCSKNNFSLDNPVYIDGLPHRIIICFGRQKVQHDFVEKSLRVFIALRYQQYEINSVAIAQKVKSLIEQWFKASIDEYLSHQLPLFSEKTLLHAEAFKVRKYKARWGSCSSRGELSFNYLLKMLPPWVVDYVIVHELCHLKYMNHSTKFWQLVERHCPEFYLAKQWLKKNQAYLSWN